MERTEPATTQITVFTSGLSRGSNLRAMAQYFAQHELPIQINCVVHTLRTVPIVDVCKELGLPSVLIPGKDMRSFESQARELILDSNIQLVVLAGFMKLLSADFINTIGIPIVNIHPALLPKYGGSGMYGKSVHQAVYKHHERVSGATVHLVDALYDHGRIIAQETVSIEDCQSPEEIGQRVLKIEHGLYGKAIAEFLSYGPQVNKS